VVSFKLISRRVTSSLPLLVWFAFTCAAFTGLANLETEGNIELSIIMGFGMTKLVLALASVLHSEGVRQIEGNPRRGT